MGRCRVLIVGCFRKFRKFCTRQNTLQHPTFGCVGRVVVRLHLIEIQLRSTVFYLQVYPILCTVFNRREPDQLTTTVISAFTIIDFAGQNVSVHRPDDKHNRISIKPIEYYLDFSCSIEIQLRSTIELQSFDCV